MVMSFCLWLAAQSTYFTLLHSRGLAAGSSSAYPNPTCVFLLACCHHAGKQAKH